MKKPAAALSVFAALVAGGCADSPSASEADGLASFEQVWTVFKHPRCANCHPKGDRPLQFDTQTPHAMNVQRGPADAGLPGMECTTCHQLTNNPDPRGPPGITGWKLAPRSMATVGDSPRDLALMLKDEKRSGMTLAEIEHHIRTAALVLWAWDPGPGRSEPPISHEAFVENFAIWIAAGAPVPDPTSTVP